RRPRASVRAPRHGPVARRRRIRRSLGRARRCARLRPHRPADAPVESSAERVRARRRHRPADLEGGFGHALRRRGAERERRALPRRPGARIPLRRPRELLRRDGLQEGAAHRLQLRPRTGAGSLPDCSRPASASAGVADEPPRQAHVPVALLARAASRARDSARRAGDAERGKADVGRRLGGAMTTTLVPGTLERDAEGFLTKPEQWNDDIAVELAHEAGIAELTERHWLVVRFMRDRYLSTGTAPTIRSLGKESGVPVKELYELFPKGPAKLAAKIGGI